MRIRSLALRTQAAIQSMYGEVLLRGEYAVFRTASVPDYWYGNCLIMPAVPGRGDFERWMALFAQEFPDKQHRVFLVDDPDGAVGEAADFLAAGFEVSRHEVLACERIVRPDRLNSAWQYRPACSRQDWNSVIETALLVNRDEAGFDRAFLERKFRAIRRVVLAGQGSWWGAWDGKINIAHMGLFWKDGLIRFQDVATHPEYRRQGLCRSLLYTACQTSQDSYGTSCFVIMPEDAAVSRIYLTVGFSPREFAVDYCRPPRP